MTDEAEPMPLQTPTVAPKTVLHAMELASVSRTELSQTARVSYRTVINLIEGSAKPRFDTARKICDAIGLTYPDDIEIVSTPADGNEILPTKDLAALRERRGESLTHFAAKQGISHAALGRAERGLYILPRTRLKIMKIYGLRKSDGHAYFRLKT